MVLDFYWGELSFNSIDFATLSSLRFQSTEHHARLAVQLRNNNNVLAFPQYFRGNAALSTETISSVVEFYQEDGISRSSTNSKDIVQINKKPVVLRFMEMTVLDAFQEFDSRHPGLVGRSTFHSLRPKNVKIVSPHDTCLCIYHENMNLLLQVRNLFNFLFLKIKKLSYRHGIEIRNGC